MPPPFTQTNAILPGNTRAVLWSGALAPSVLQAPGAVAPGTGHVLLQSGAGRLQAVLAHVSGNVGRFYDATTVAGSGVGCSGTAIIGLVPGGTAGVWAVQGPQFFSGLCVEMSSGTAGFTVLWTPGTNA